MTQRRIPVHFRINLYNVIALVSTVPYTHAHLNTIQLPDKNVENLQQTKKYSVDFQKVATKLLHLSGEGQWENIFFAFKLLRH